MKEYFGLEIYEMSKHAPPRIWYRSDLYPTREKAEEAFLDLETREAFAALDCIQSAEDPPFQFDGEHTDIDDYFNAYLMGVQEIVEVIDNLLAWVRGEREDSLFEFGQAVENASKVHERILTIPNKNRKRKKEN
jgi:hypothetical protein